MKTILSTIALVLLCGCTHIVVTRSGTNTTMHATSLLANSTLKSLNLDGTTKTTASLLKLSGVTTEPNPEAITASAEGLGNIIGTAVGAAAKSAVK